MGARPIAVLYKTRKGAHLFLVVSAALSEQEREKLAAQLGAGWIEIEYSGDVEADAGS